MNNHQKENVGSHQKKIPHVQRQRRSPSKTVRGAKSHLESNPIPARDAWRAQTSPSKVLIGCAPGPRDPTETEPELGLSVSCLLLGRKAMTNLGSILKSRDITLPTKAHLVKSIIFPAVKYGCESWTTKKAEH